MSKPKTSPVTNGAVGHRIKAYRVRRGLSQEQLGEAVGVSYQSINHYEKGRSSVVPEMLGKLAEALRCRARDLLP
jgi:transcriptional regulator with XRE-family HTH domain